MPARSSPVSGISGGRPLGTTAENIHWGLRRLTWGRKGTWYFPASWGGMERALILEMVALAAAAAVVLYVMFGPS
jgi:hypothetical protein